MVVVKQYLTLHSAWEWEHAWKIEIAPATASPALTVPSLSNADWYRCGYKYTHTHTCNTPAFSLICEVVCRSQVQKVIGFFARASWDANMKQAQKCKECQAEIEREVGPNADFEEYDGHVCDRHSWDPIVEITWDFTR